MAEKYLLMTLALIAVFLLLKLLQESLNWLIPRIASSSVAATKSVAVPVAGRRQL